MKNAFRTAAATLGYCLASGTVGIAKAQAPLPTSGSQNVDAAAALPRTEPTTAWELDSGILYQGHGEARSAVALPGPVLALQPAGERAYVALGELGAAVVVHTGHGTSVEKLIPISHGSVTGFLMIDSKLWMQVNSTSAVQLGEVAGTVSSVGPITPIAPLPSSTPSSSPNSTRAKAGTPGVAEQRPLKIVKVFDGLVMLNQGKNQGLRAGDQLKVVQSEALVDEGGSYQGEHEVAVLVVDSVSAESSRARIWRGDRVTLEDRVERADRSTSASLVYPRQLHGFTEAEVHLRPILNIGQTGFGVLFDGNLTHFAEHYFVGLRSQPLGFGRSAGSTAFTQTSILEGGYNSRPFALGLGVGVTSVYGDLGTMFELTSFKSNDSGLGGGPQVGPGPWHQDMQHAFTLGQRVRLGAMDGLNLTVANNLLYFGGQTETATRSSEKAGFIWGGTNARLTVPLALNADMFFEGGGGVTGFAYGAVGIFSWLRGNGGGGSLGLLASAGGAGVWSTRTREVRYDLVAPAYQEEETVEIAGPLVSLGARYRFEL
ncbi:MAG: FlgT C-terminal domain-containing protein [Polyangiaceae bacterium]|nr:FlgT C-terminal domain-containing protein [Polyangiaceae bacterium]